MNEAVSSGDIEQVKSLIERDADINAKNEQDEIPFYRSWKLLHRTVLGDNGVAMAKFLLDHGVDVDEKTAYPVLS